VLLALASFTLVLVAAAPATAARGTAQWVLLEQAPPKAKRVLKAQRALAKANATAAAKAKSEPAKRKRKPKPKPKANPRKHAAPPLVEAAVPPALTATSITPNDPLWRDSWSLGKVHALGAWNLTTGASETVVAVLDTGADLTHPDLQGAFVAGYDTVNEDADPTDDHGHGTMVAGVIAARANNGIGVVGACWRCSVMPVKVIGANGLGTAPDIAEGIVWATGHGARVINLSFTLSASDGAVAAAIEHARASGVVVVAAAGNTGTSDVTYPAAYPGVVSVAGTDAADARYSWSNYGSWVRLAAPGCNQTTAPGGTYGDFCGTSSATAFVSGLAGLLRSYAGQLSPDAIAQALSANSAQVGDFVSTGRVDAAGMLASLKTP
jgi:subtilisin family serine protease